MNAFIERCLIIYKLFILKHKVDTKNGVKPFLIPKWNNKDVEKKLISWIGNPAEKV